VHNIQLSTLLSLAELAALKQFLVGTDTAISLLMPPLLLLLLANDVGMMMKQEQPVSDYHSAAITDIMSIHAQSVA